MRQGVSGEVMKLPKPVSWRAFLWFSGFNVDEIIDLSTNSLTWSNIFQEGWIIWTISANNSMNTLGKRAKVLQLRSKTVSV